MGVKYVKELNDYRIGPRSYDFYNDRDTNNDFKRRNKRNGYNELPAKSQKSFYGKAIIKDCPNGGKILVSYNTPVCGYVVDPETGALEFERYWDEWSKTTSIHINDFRDAFGDAPINKREWMSLPVKRVPRCESKRVNSCKRVKESKWSYKISQNTANALRDAIDGADYDTLYDAIRNILVEINKINPDALDEYELEDMLNDVDMAESNYLDADYESYELDDVEEEVDYILSEIYDICDANGIWIPLSM